MDKRYYRRNKPKNGHRSRYQGKPHGTPDRCSSLSVLRCKKKRRHSNTAYLRASQKNVKLGPRDFHPDRRKVSGLKNANRALHRDAIRCIFSAIRQVRRNSRLPVGTTDVGLVSRLSFSQQATRRDRRQRYIRL